MTAAFTAHPTDIARHLFITGRVQGVAFRASMRDEAMRLGTHGWVRNLRDGRVEAMIHGTEDAVIALLAWARQGPPGARVDQVDVEIGEAGATGFLLRETR